MIQEEIVSLRSIDSWAMPYDCQGGVFLIDKPAGPTSFAMVRQLRRLLGIQKIGHAGTLDPFASGLLILCAGRTATKMTSVFMQGEKEYLATLCLGVETETFDPEGAVSRRCPVGSREGKEIEKVLGEFRGRLLQTPPAYSALKHKGKPLYHYARKGVNVVKEPREIHIPVLERIDGEHDLVGEECLLRLRIVCSKGTYIRSLAADIGNALGCGAYLKELRRTRVGCFSVEDAVAGELLSSGNAIEQVLRTVISVDDACKILQKSNKSDNIAACGEGVDQ